MKKREGMSLEGGKYSIDWSANELVLPTDPTITNKLEHEVVSRLKTLKWPEESINRIIVSITEALNNAILHGNLDLPSEADDPAAYKQKKIAALAGELAKRKVYVSLDLNDKKLIVKIKDEGRGIPEEGLPDPTAEENIMREAGRGLFLIGKMADEVYIGGTEIAMVFYNKLDETG